jgi:hypothetical protein
MPLRRSSLRGGVKLVDSPFVSAMHAIVHSKVVIDRLDDSNSKALEIGY